MSYNLNATSPLNIFVELEISSSKIFIPFSTVSLNLVSSFINVLVMRSFALSNSGYEFLIPSKKIGNSLWNTGSLLPKEWACRIPLLIILRKTYPLPSFEGITPSAIKKEEDFKWSAITLWLGFVIELSSPHRFVDSFIIGWNKSVE